MIPPLQYRLVVSDMDGTLLRRDKTLSDRTIRAVQRFQAAGGHFTLATGRAPEAIERYIEALQLRTPLILVNGSLLYDPVSATDLLVRHLAPESAAAAWRLLEAHDLTVVAHDTRVGMIREVNEILRAHMRHDGILLPVRPDLSPATAGPLVKILSMGTEEQVERAEAAIREAGIPVRLVRSLSTYLEVLPPDGGKGAALDDLLSLLGLEREQSLALGDYLNDLDLLRAAGLGVAMANAHPDLKRVADCVTASNEEDGVALILEALVEGQPIEVMGCAG